VNPIAVVVALYPVNEVNGNAETLADVKNPASLLNHESLIDDEAIV
jgi:hypothetical protein